MPHKYESPAPLGGGRASKAVPAGNLNHSGKNKRPRAKAQQRKRARIDFDAIAKAALAYLPAWVAAWAPHGRREGHEYVALNPCRADRQLGSFRVNLRTGAWADFAIEGARGGDAVSLCAYLHNISQAEAARQMARALGMEASRG